MKKIGFLLLMCLFFVQTFAQDFHLSQYWASPLKLNIAQTGLFDGTLRLATSYRNQWFQTKTYSTGIVSIDFNLFKNKLHGNILGLGFGFYQEIEGDGAFKNTGANFSLAFNKLIETNKLNHYIGFGIDYSFLSRQINLKNAIYGNLFDSGQNIDPLDNYNFKSMSITDFGLGVNYFLDFNQKHKVSLGVNIAHLIQPNIGFTNLDEEILYRLYSVNMSSKIALKGKFSAIIPLILFQNQGPHTECSLGSYFKFSLNNKEKIAMYFGAQYRLSAHQSKSFASDAIILGFRAEYKGFDLGVSYDVTLSKLRNSKLFYGGPEVYLMYILKNKKNKSMACPKF